MRDWLALNGRRALVVGAGGLGGASAVSLAAQGASVVLVDVDEGNLEAVAKAVKQAGGAAETLVADLRSADRCRAAVGGPSPGSVASASSCRRGARRAAAGARSSATATGTTWSGSTCPPRTGWRAVGRRMVEAGYGRIVFVSSVSGLLAHPDHAPYAATKGGLNQLCRVMAREWASAGVTVNAVAPGYIETDMTRDHLDKDGNREALTRLVPAKRLGVPEEVADAVTFLASDRAGFVTGHVLYVDGGRVLVRPLTPSEGRPCPCRH
jgi:NAD(P)-dependent dehydrogenase (short-subunit alcohol dehydrogenase family)